MVTAFILGTGRRRVALHTLTRPRAEGGLAVPDYETYYLAVQFQWLTQWIAEAIRGNAEHRDADRANSLLYRIILKLLINPTALSLELSTARKCWNRYLRRTSIKCPYATEIPLSMCKTLPHGGTWHRLEAWAEPGLTCLGDLYEENAMVPFNDLQTRFDIPGGDFLQFTALTAAVRKHWGHALTEPQTSLACQYVVVAAGTFKSVTCLYRRMTREALLPLTALKTKLEVDVGTEIPDKAWEKIV